MTIIQLSLVMGRPRQACYHGSLIMKDITERFVLVVRASDSQGLLEDCVDFLDE